ncbi:MAG TPA: hypothetical protein VD905_17780 [Flavobacteriales bacterium]|nr:hypothetical protein [Flavobacteriales bacterium]
MNFNLPIALFLLSSFYMMGTVSCGNDKSGEKILARVGNVCLYASDLQGVPETQDSIGFVRNYTQNWINNQVLLQATTGADEGSTNEIDKKVEKFRQDLLLAEYEKNFLAKNLDTVVTEKQINGFYASHKPLFELRDYVVNVFYMRFDANEKSAETAGREIQNCKTPEDASRIEQKYAAVATNSYLDPDAWLFFNDLLREVPVNVEDKARFLQNNRFFETSNDNEVYYVRIFDYKLKDETSPMNLVRPKIKNLILRERSQKLVEENRKTLIKKFSSSTEIENYVK